MDYNYVANQIVLMFMAGRPTTEGVDVREVEAWVKEAHANIGRQEYFENYKAENQSNVNGQWLVSYSLPVVAPGVNDPMQYYRAVLAENYLPLPKNRGVVRVSVADADYKAKKQIAFISLDNYENLRGGSAIKFQIKIKNITVTQAVANDATLNEAHIMLIVNQVMPLMMQRFGRKADMTIDANPNA